MEQLKLLDLYCGGGGCSVGYERAGYAVTGVDIVRPRYYPERFKFIQADALQVLDDLDFCRSFDLIHASPVCKAYSVANHINGNKHPEDIPVVREKLKVTGIPYVIENVPGAPLKNYVELCGSMFGLRVIRHRLFECWPEIWFPPYTCNCIGITGSHRGISSFQNGAMNITVAGNNYRTQEGRQAMGINWIGNKKELSQAIPPAYTEWVGGKMKEFILIEQ